MHQHPLIPLGARSSSRSDISGMKAVMPPRFPCCWSRQPAKRFTISWRYRRQKRPPDRLSWRAGPASPRPLRNVREFEVLRASEHKARDDRGQYHKRFAEAVPPAAAVGYHLVTVMTPVSSANTGSRTSADHPMKPKKLGILTPRSVAIAYTMKLGALPI